MRNQEAFYLPSAATKVGHLRSTALGRGEDLVRHAVFPPPESVCTIQLNHSDRKARIITLGPLVSFLSHQSPPPTLHASISFLFHFLFLTFGCCLRRCRIFRLHPQRRQPDCLQRWLDLEKCSYTCHTRVTRTVLTCDPSRSHFLPILGEHCLSTTGLLAQ